MAFCWHSPNNALTAEARAERRERDIEHEIGAKADLLRRLGYSEGVAVKRIQSDLHWDHDIGAGKAPIDRVQDIVSGVFSRKTVGGGGAPSIE